MIKRLMICFVLIATNATAQDSVNQLINPDGGVMSKELYLGRVADGSVNYIEWEPEEIRGKLYGESAVLRYRAHLRLSVTVAQDAMCISGTQIFMKGEMVSGKVFGRTPPWLKSSTYCGSATNTR
jgi:hypothetical protein